MGGHLGHRNNADRGSTFTLELPAGVEDTPAVPAARAEAAAPVRDLRVLVVDDATVNRTVSAGMLRQAGHRVTEADCGESAVQLAQAADFDLILMDMRMPDMDGVEATRRIRALPGARGQVPIVAVTANALDAHAEECRRSGMCDHLAKPFTQTELLNVVSRATGIGCQAPNGAATIDGDAIAQLTACMGGETVQRLFDCLTLRLEALLRRLEDPVKTPVKELAELAHELAGSSGTLGLMRLSAVARRFEATVGTPAANGNEMRREAAAALTELRQRRTMEAMLVE
jgi:CheY-like chemotaxis protein/HPt (histidine-containing phosphotransfer) domain-containing protein